MKHVWKCDFCVVTSEDKQLMILHEDECSFNPKNKNCWTCKHRVDGGAPISGFWNECRLNRWNQREVEDGTQECSVWEVSDDH